MANYELLATRRVNTIMRAVRDVRELPQNLLFLNRTPVVNATDGEIMAFWDGNVYIADIIADGQRAVVRQTGKVTMEANRIPNVKHGEPFDQEMLNLLDRINAGGAIRDDERLITDYMTRSMDRLLLGVRQTMELMRIGCARDNLTWNRLGVQFTATFGTPSVLKPTVSISWVANPTTALPVTDILTHIQLRQSTYNEPTDRLTMTSTAFGGLYNSTEFKSLAASLYSPLAGTNVSTIPVADRTRMMRIAGELLNVEIELYDAKYFTQNSAGQVSTAQSFLPSTEVIFGSRANDNDGTACDIANAIVTESIVAGLTGTNFAGPAGEGFGGPQYGPIGYTTLATHDMNPPGVNNWAVARCFPRKLRKTAESVMTIG